MRAKLERDQDILVVHLMGRINLDAVETFRHTCLTRLAGEKLIFNFSELAFVGSMGVSGFLETMGLLGGKNPHTLRFCHVGAEYQRMLMVKDFVGIEIYETLELAKQSFVQQPAETQEPAAAQHPRAASQDLGVSTTDSAAGSVTGSTAESAADSPVSLL